MAKQLDPGAKRNILAIGAAALVGLVVVAGLIMSFLGKKSSASPVADGTNATVTVSTAGAQTDVGEVSPSLRDKADRAEAAEAADAEKEGQSHFPKGSNSDVVAVAASSVDSAGSSQYESERLRYGQSDRSGSDDQVDVNPRDATRRQGLEEQLKRLGLIGKDGGQSVGSGEAVAMTKTEVRSQGSGGVADSAAAVAVAAGGVSADAPKVVGKLLVKSHAIAVAKTLSEADNYRSKKLIAELTSGAMRGAMLFGEVTWVEEGARCHFTKMTLEDVTYDIDADCLNEGTAGDVLDVEVDNRWMQRLVLPVMIGSARGYATARANPGQEVVNTPAGQTVSTAQSSGKQAAQAGIAAGMSVGEKLVEKEASQPVRLKVLPQGVIGILFNKEVRAVVP